MFSIGQYLQQVRETKEDNQNVINEERVVIPTEKDTSIATVDYTSLIRTNQTKGRTIQSSINDVKPLSQTQRHISLARPSEEEVKATTERTKAALDAILNQKLGKAITNKKKSEFVRYTSSNVLSDGAPTSSRIIKIIDVQQDPMAPSKFKQKKQLERPPSPPAPILHGPARKATAEEQKQWYIPPAISNWKNPNGFTIALDKRLAVDGRDPNLNSTEGQVNQNFIDLATALEETDKEVREEIKLRNAMKKKLAEKENREKEEKLKQLAQKAREERLNSHRSQISNHYNNTNDNDNDERHKEAGARERALIREERRRKAEKELRISRMGNEQKLKTMVRSLGDREVSERTQLGLSKASNLVENQFDSRLFTNSTQVTNSEDQVYDNPLFAQQALNNLYKVSDSNNDLESDLKNEKRFDGLSKNEGPVQFEKSFNEPKRENSEEDYGLQVKRQKSSNK